MDLALVLLTLLQMILENSIMRSSRGCWQGTQSLWLDVPAISAKLMVRMKSPVAVPVNTLENTLEVAKQLAVDLRAEGKARRNYRIFAALTNDRLEALTAYLIWRIRGQSLTPPAQSQPIPSSATSLFFSSAAVRYPRSR